MESLKSSLKKLSQETALYGASTIIGRFLNFLLVPFYVNVLNTRVEFGLQTSLYAYMAFLSVVFPLGMEGAYFRYAARAEGKEEDTHQEKRLFSTPFWLIAGVSSLAAFLLFIAAPNLIQLAFGDPNTDLTPYEPLLVQILQLASLILILDALAIVPFASLRLEHRAKAFATIKISNILLTLVLNFFFILQLHWGIVGIFRANAIASLLTLIAVLFCSGKRLGFCFDQNILFKMLPFGLANVPAYLGAMMVQVIDRPIVQRLQGLDQAAIYQANYRMGIAMMVLVSVFDYAWRPFFLRQYATHGEGAKPLFARVFTYTTLFSMVAFLGFSFFLPWFVGVEIPFIHHSLLRSDYLSGTNIIPVVLLAYVFQGFYTNFIVGIYVREQARWLPLATGLGALTNVVTNLIWIPKYGIMGAAAATLAAYIIMAIGIYYASQRLFRIPYDWNRVIQIFMIVLTAAGIGLWIGTGIAKILIFITVLVLLGITKYKAPRKQ